MPDPEIINPRDAIVKVSSTAICGSDLHFYNGRVMGFEKGDVVGHEFMGEVVEARPGGQNAAVGDRVVVPFPIACGALRAVRARATSLCDNSNPNAYLVEAAYGYAPSALFGYSHLFGGYAGGQAEYVRVPFADVGPMNIESDLSDEKVFFFPTSFRPASKAAETMRHRAGRRRRGVGLRTRRAIRDQERLYARRRASVRVRPLRVPPRTRAFVRRRDRGRSARRQRRRSSCAR